MKKCKSCQKEIDPKATKCPHCQSDQRNWFMRHKITTVIFLFILIGMASGSNKSENRSSTSMITASSEKKTEAPKTAETSQSINQPSKSEPKVTVENKQPNIPVEYKSALNKAASYANTMHMSKKGVYDQLVSQYGEKFSAEAAQYAIDNVKADWNANALYKAKSYQSQMSMSPAAIHDQLVSEYGEKFTQAEADYAIQNLVK